MEKDTTTVNTGSTHLQGIATYHDDRLAIIDNPSKELPRNKPVRTNAFIATLCLKGAGTVCINGERHIVHANELMVYPPNTIVEHADASKDLEIRCLYISPETIVHPCEKPAGGKTVFRAEPDSQPAS